MSEKDKIQARNFVHGLAYTKGKKRRKRRILYTDTMGRNLTGNQKESGAAVANLKKDDTKRKEDYNENNYTNMGGLYLCFLLEELDKVQKYLTFPSSLPANFAAAKLDAKL